MYLGRSKSTAIGLYLKALAQVVQKRLPQKRLPPKIAKQKDCPKRDCQTKDCSTFKIHERSNLKLVEGFVIKSYYNTKVKEIQKSHIVTLTLILFFDKNKVSVAFIMAIQVVFSVLHTYKDF